MGQKTVAILLTITLLGSQVGKVAGYLGCSWKQAFVTEQDCHCERYLTDLFIEDQGTDDYLASTIHLVQEEYPRPDCYFESTFHVLTSARNLIIREQLISDPFAEPAFRPPAQARF